MGTKPGATGFDCMKLHALRRGDIADAPIVNQARVDAIMAAARASSPQPLQRPLYRVPAIPPLQASGIALELRVQEEMELMRRMLDAVGDQLANDPILLTRYQATLQSIDIISQTLGHLARVIGSEDKSEAINRIGMDNLKARLARSTGKIEGDGALPSLRRSDSNPFAQQ